MFYVRPFAYLSEMLPLTNLSKTCINKALGTFSVLQTDYCYLVTIFPKFLIFIVSLHQRSCCHMVVSICHRFAWLICSQVSLVVISSIWRSNMYIYSKISTVIYPIYFVTDILSFPIRGRE